MLTLFNFENCIDALGGQRVKNPCSRPLDRMYLNVNQMCSFSEEEKTKQMWIHDI